MSSDNDTLVREFVEAFNTKDSDRLAPYLHPDVVFQAYGDGEVRGRDAVLQSVTPWPQAISPPVPGVSLPSRRPDGHRQAPRARTTQERP